MVKHYIFNCKCKNLSTPLTLCCLYQLPFSSFALSIIGMGHKTEVPQQGGLMDPAQVISSPLIIIPCWVHTAGTPSTSCIASSRPLWAGSPYGLKRVYHIPYTQCITIQYPCKVLVSMLICHQLE